MKLAYVYLEIPKCSEYPSYSNEDDYVHRQYVENGLTLGWAEAEELPISINHV